ncbi:UDP-glycosyltransferase 72B3-like [Lotus japonicus]|uniref:Glycosyltransferase n=1 Tax=Lotus japonicus TaxID=34305 RepID=A0A186MTU2_LOTJA|nr:UDP-glycosyltransferase 72B3-like [Lotus japonicus]AKK25345.1 flavonoid glycosyltransferase [Lotus japonicus]
MTESTKPHVAFLPSLGVGILTPHLELAKLLVNHHGFQVTFFYITTDASPAQNNLINSADLPPDLHIVHLPPLDLSAVITLQTRVLTRFSLNVQENLPHIKTLLIQLIPKPQALIIDVFCTQALDFQESLPNVPIFTFATASAHFLAFSLFLPQLDRDVVEGQLVDLPGPVQVPGCQTIRPQDLIDQATDRNNDEYKWYLYHFKRVSKSAGIIMNTWQDLEPVTLNALREHPFYRNIHTPPIYPIGPIVKETEPITETGSECLTWLDKQPTGSVLFVSLGSRGVLSAEQQTEFAWGLELSGQRFLWVVRAPSDISSATLYNVGGVGSHVQWGLPEGFVERTRGRGMVVGPWAPQVSVLRNTSTGAFVSHCGWNSTLESVAYGLPMIAWPLYSEQRMNAAMVAEVLGVGVRMEGEGGVVGRKEIERVVRMVLEGEEGRRLRQRAIDLGESSVKALRLGGDSCLAWAALANQLNGQCNEAP